ncbi:precorrin-3B C17-methyltransferase [Thiohalorhabdus denitrificans]|uniref:Precorrin-3B C17-methyltransferase n=1 Tax=Thiohalorhabdus denitrificans TaxID=381306 RepID=A0A0P9EKH1_9GAMM|nr:precorrin-3B C(17)-methyltransferase [Thiohalorhabdus denitrificans]KPV39066.1 precorrin-3B C17-methyltransferase [Thiohalorhabdus denitrificans]SCX78523.1 precorrin-3B C17-methyltransferase [Thiohalorhabdus denitrificans]
MSGEGWVAVVGTGPAGPEWLTPETAGILEQATDLVGYGPYLDRVAAGHQRRHASDNREELARAGHALDLAAEGAKVAVVSGGDPGVFAMGAAVLEAVDRDTAGRWRDVEVTVHPGVSAMQAAAARLGAPLGADFCAISLSDNLKPLAVVERRVRLAAEAGLVMALYNPASRARPWQLGRVLEVLGEVHPPQTPVIFATAAGRGDQERLTVTTLAEADPARADMRTLVLVGIPATRVLQRPDGTLRVYTPRYYEEAE